MIDKKTLAIAVVLSVILSTALSYGIIMTVPQVQDTLRGPKGETGLQGEQGKSGPEGEVGPQGLQGEVGLQGSQGESGPQGLQGPQGEPYSFEGLWYEVLRSEKSWSGDEYELYTEVFKITSDLWYIEWVWFSITGDELATWSIGIYRGAHPEIEHEEEYFYTEVAGTGSLSRDRLYLFGKGEYTIRVIANRQVLLSIQIAQYGR